MSTSYTAFHGRALMSRHVQGFLLRETVHQAGLMIPKHSHENAHLAFVLDGSFDEVCEGRVLECKPKSLSFLAPGMMHSDKFERGVHCLLIELSPDRFDSVTTVIDLDKPVFLNEGKAS